MPEADSPTASPPPHDDSKLLNPPAGFSQVERLKAIVHRLRGPGGCPWDAEQTHQSLLPNLLEECYELLDTIQRNDIDHLREELGDVLLQVVFHAELAKEAKHFDLEDAAKDICEKLIRRHPHVFANSNAQDTQSVLTQWEQIKRAEKGTQNAPYLHHVGRGLPSLMRAAKIQKKVAKVGFDWHHPQEIIEKIQEETNEVAAELDRQNCEKLEEELGDLLFAVVNLARHQGIDPEIALTGATNKFVDRFNQVETLVNQSEYDLGNAPLETLEQFWQEAKAQNNRH